MIIVAIVAAYIAAKTPRGRHIYAVGGNERAATLSGVRVNSVKMFVYMFSGFCSAIGGLIWASQLVASHPMTGETFELHAIAAAVLGGTSLSGGRGTIGGTIIGAFVIRRYDHRSLCHRNSGGRDGHDGCQHFLENGCERNRNYRGGRS
jgi:erythritol transport system permease protein